MSAALISAATAAFTRRFGRPPGGVSFAPGRVNLIGEHVDYNDGLVLPMPIREGTAVAWAQRDDGQIHAHALDLNEHDAFAAPTRPDHPGWRSYLRGMVHYAAPQGPGLDLLITGNLPRGAGLSSSASLCIAIGRALAAAAAAGQPAGQPADAIALARAGQSTEHHFAGVACGIMDQMAIAAGQSGHAMLLDCQSLAATHHPLPPDWTVLIIDSGLRRGLVEGEYNQRRASCEAAARALGVPSLRTASASQLAALPQGTQHRRAAHVIAEIARVRAATKALANADLPAFGALLREGHASLRDLFEVSLPAIDTLVDAINAHLGSDGAARLTGAGFGGSVVAVLPRRRAEGLRSVLAQPVITAF